jgi:Cof subfamily protein (haloacid dehalogenase superfamily)
MIKQEFGTKVVYDMYKLIAVDMDGTLLRRDKTISEKTKKAISLAKSKGVKIVLATGRPPAGVKNYLKELDILDTKDYVIAFNGAAIQNTHSGELLLSTSLSMSDLSYLYSLSKKLEVNIHAFSSEGLITPKMSKYTGVESTINNIPAQIVDFDSLDPSTRLIKIMMVDEASKLDSAVRNLPQDIYEKYTVVRSCPYFLEFLDKSSNKGEAVKALASHLDISIEDVICIGDAGNDYHMIKYAGLGVAMGNAFEEVKAIADYITRTNEEDGVAHVIHKFVV